MSVFYEGMSIRKTQATRVYWQQSSSRNEPLSLFSRRRSVACLSATSPLLSTWFPLLRWMKEEVVSFESREIRQWRGGDRRDVRRERESCTFDRDWRRGWRGRRSRHGCLVKKKKKKRSVGKRSSGERGALLEEKETEEWKKIFSPLLFFSRRREEKVEGELKARRKRRKKREKVKQECVPEKRKERLYGVW